MRPIKFDEYTKILTRPPEMTDKQCGPLHVYEDRDSLISCWRPTLRERLSILFFGRVWLYVWGHVTQPPVAMQGARTIFVKAKKS